MAVLCLSSMESEMPLISTPYNIPLRPAVLAHVPVFIPARRSVRARRALLFVSLSLLLSVFTVRRAPAVLLQPSILVCRVFVIFLDVILSSIPLAWASVLATTTDLDSETCRLSPTCSASMTWLVALARMSMLNQLGPACASVRSSTYSVSSRVG